MKLDDRLKKIEAKVPEEKKIIVVKFTSEVRELTCGNQIFLRYESESEDEFILRIRSLIELRLNRPLVTVLVANF